MGLKIKIVGKDKESYVENMTSALTIACMIARRGFLPEEQDVKNNLWVKKGYGFLLAPLLGEQKTHIAKVIDEGENYVVLEFFYIWDSAYQKQYTFNSVTTYAVYHILSEDNTEIIENM